MGTLLDQPVRRMQSIDSINEEIAALAIDLNISRVQAADRLLILEKIALIRMQKRDFDIKDEQLAGFGEFFREFSLGIMNSIDNLASEIASLKED